MGNTQYFSDALLSAVLSDNRFTVSVYTCKKKILTVIMSELLAFSKCSIVLIFIPLSLPHAKLNFARDGLKSGGVAHGFSIFWPGHPPFVRDLCAENLRADWGQGYGGLGGRLTTGRMSVSELVSIKESVLCQELADPYFFQSETCLRLSEPRYFYLIEVSH